LRTIIEGVEIHYEIHGQGPPLLLIHGLGSSTRDWEFQREHFAARFQVIAFDVRGHGQSGKPPGPYSIRQFAADAAGLLRQLGTAPAHVVGLSMGGMIAFQLALDAPDLVRTLTIVNSGPEVVVRSWQQRLQLLQRRFILRWLGMRAMGRLLARRLLPAPEHATLRQTFEDRWAENDARAYRDAFSALIGWSVSDRVHEIRCPTLVLASEFDYTSVSDKRAWVARMPNASLVVLPDSRHAVPVERPQLFNAALDRFLAARNAPLQ
jgi:pimeloyl-ACP methyl ester carboxylesterase